MSMLYITIHQLISIILFSTAYTPGVFQINGEVDDNNSNTKIVLQWSCNGIKKKDTAKIVNHQFHFKDHIDYPVLCNLIIVAENKEPVIKEFFLEASNIIINIKNHFSLFQVKGSKSNLEYLELLSMLQPLQLLQDSLNEQHDIFIENFQQLRKNNPPSTVDLDKLRITIYNLEDSIDVLENDKYPIYKEFIYNHRQSYVSCYSLIVWQRYYINPKEARPALNYMSKKIQSTSEMKKFEQALSFFEQTEPGKIAPSFSLPDSSKHFVSLKNYLGKYVLLDFWASWCHPCREENQKIIGIYTQFKEKGFEVIGIAMDQDRKAWVKAITDDHLPWMNLCDFKLKEGEAAQKYIWNTLNQAYTLPQNVLVDKNGVIVARNIKINELSRQLSNFLNK